MGDLDVILCAGQSNMLFGGVGDYTASPTPDPALALTFDGTSVVPLVANGGAHPSFAQTYNCLTRRAVLLVPAAVGSSSQSSISDLGAGNWDITGTLFGLAQTKLNAALVAAATAGWTTHYLGVWWAQGETDADYADTYPNAYNAGMYKNTLWPMISRFWAEHPGSFFWISRVGEGAALGFPQAQEDIASYYRNTANVRMVFRGALSFPGLGLKDGTSLHYSQHGYNLMGEYSARGVVNNGMPNDRFLYEGIYPNATRTELQAD